MKNKKMADPKVILKVNYELTKSVDKKTVRRELHNQGFSERAAVEK